MIGFTTKFLEKVNLKLSMIFLLKLLLVSAIVLIFAFVGKLLITIYQDVEIVNQQIQVLYSKNQSLCHQNEMLREQLFQMKHKFNMDISVLKHRQGLLLGFFVLNLALLPLTWYYSMS